MSATHFERPMYAVAGHRPGLDGVRGWAVIAVVAFHSGALHAGWVGVDVFMALSGYLITGVLLNALSCAPGLRLGTFWMRRARRLFPGLFVLLAGVAVLSWWSPSNWPVATQRETLGALTYSSNWIRIAAEQSYWELFRAPSALDHLWSLAIEEQFYVIWPILVLGAWKLRGRMGVAWIAGLLGLALAGLQVGLSLSGSSVERIYVGTDTRAPAFLAGAVLMAVGAGRSWSLSKARRIGVVAAAVIVAASVWLDGQSTSTYRGLLLLVSGAGAVLAACSARLNGTRRIDQVVTGRWIGLIGRWSYGIYLFHWPLAILLQPRVGPPLLRFALVIGASSLVAAASYRWIEQPIREQRHRRPWRLAGLVAASVVAASVLAVARVPLPEIDAATAAELRAPLEKAPTAIVPATPETALSAPAAIPSTTVAVQPRLLVVGDSVVFGMRDQLVALGADRGLNVAVRAAPGCTMSALPADQNNLFSTDLCATIRLKLHDDVVRFQPNQVIAFLGGTWKPFRWQGQEFDPCSVDGQAAMAQAGDQFVGDLSSSGAQVALVVPPQMAGEYSSGAIGAAPCYADAYIALQARWPQVTSLEPADLLICPVWAAECPTEINGAEVRYDGLHFTETGGQLVINWLFDRLLL